MTISCIITCYNNGRDLIDAIESVLAQTRPVSEIIVADDCSTDGSWDEIRRLAKAHPVIRPIQRERNVGITLNRDLAIRAASEPFITYMDGDDAFFAEKIERESAVLDGDPNAVAFSSIVILNADDVAVRVMDTSPVGSLSHEDLVRCLADRSVPIPRDFLMSKSLYEEVGGHRPISRMYEDWDFKLRLALSSARWVWSEAVGTLYRRTGRGISFSEATEHQKSKSAVLEANRQAIVDLLGHKEFDRIVKAAVPTPRRVAPPVTAKKASDVWMGKRPAVPHEFNSLGRGLPASGRPDSRQGTQQSANSDPAISIVTPVLNRAELIGECLESVASQSVPPLEHIVVDGGSTDGTIEVCRRFPHVRVIEAPGAGIYEAVNIGFDAARGDVVGWLNSDDFYAPGTFEAVVNAFRAHDGAEIVSGGVSIFENTGEGASPRIRNSTLAACETQLSLYNVTFGNPAINARFFRRSLLSRIGDFDTRLTVTADRDWMLRCIGAGARNVSLNRIACRYRAHDGSITFGPNRPASGWPEQDCAYAAAHLKGDLRNHPEKWILRSWHSLRSVAAFQKHIRARKPGAAIRLAAHGIRHNGAWPVIAFLTLNKQNMRRATRLRRRLSRLLPALR